jgi:lincosamide nucleotidyltransferase A/C/D/E
MMTSKDIINLYTQLESKGIKIWIDGGWAVDALLGKQTRSHKDMDIAIEWKDVPGLRQFLEPQGYKQIKEDNRWNFVLANDQGHEVDIHAFVFDDQGNVADGIEYPTASLTGTGAIEGEIVRCISPEYMVQFLAPWIHKWPEKYVSAVSALCEKFNIALPKEYLDFEQHGQETSDL